MLPICHSAFHCKVNQYRTNIPFNYTGRCIPKAQRGPLQNQVAAFQRYKIHFKKSLSLPHGNHWLSSIITRPHTTRFSGAHFFCSVYQKITTNYFVIFVDWFWRLELDLLKNHYKHLRGFFQGILKGLLLDSLVFVVTLYPGWGCTFCSDFFFGLCMDNVVIGVGQSYFTATKSWPNSPPQIPTPIVIVVLVCYKL